MEKNKWGEEKVGEGPKGKGKERDWRGHPNSYFWLRHCERLMWKCSFILTNYVLRINIYLKSSCILLLDEFMQAWREYDAMNMMVHVACCYSMVYKLHHYIRCLSFTAFSTCYRFYRVCTLLMTKISRALFQDRQTTFFHDLVRAQQWLNIRTNSSYLLHIRESSQVSSLNILDNNIFYDLYISEMYIVYEL